MGRVYTFLVIILILTFSLEARMTSELAYPIYSISSYKMISCTVVMKTRGPFEIKKGESVRSRVKAIRELLSFKYKYWKLNREELGIGGIRSSIKSYTIYNKLNFNHI